MDTDYLPTGPADHNRYDDDLLNLDDEQLQAEVARLEAKHWRQETITRIQYLRSVGTLSIEEQRAPKRVKSQRLPPPKSSGGVKSPATGETFAASPSKHYSGGDNAKLKVFIMGLEIFFKAEGIDVYDLNVGGRAIKTAATWLDGEALQAYYRLPTPPSTWEEFKEFLRGTVIGPHTSIADATYIAQFKRQRRAQTVRQYRDELEQAEAEVEASHLDEAERKMWQFLHGLRPELRHAIMDEPQGVSASRDTVLTAAIRHETRLSRGKGKRKRKPGFEL